MQILSSLTGFRAQVSRYQAGPPSGGWPIQTSAGARALEHVVQDVLRSALDAVESARALQARGLAIGFDLVRAQYAVGVQSGWIERSLLASARLERRLDLLERWALGPWARSV